MSEKNVVPSESRRPPVFLSEPLHEKSTLAGRLNAPRGSRKVKGISEAPPPVRSSFPSAASPRSVETMRDEPSYADRQAEPKRYQPDDFLQPLDEKTELRLYALSPEKRASYERWIPKWRANLAMANEMLRDLAAEQREREMDIRILEGRLGDRKKDIEACVPNYLTGETHLERERLFRQIDIIRMQAERHLSREEFSRDFGIRQPFERAEAFLIDLEKFPIIQSMLRARFMTARREFDARLAQARAQIPEVIEKRRKPLERRLNEMLKLLDEKREELLSIQRRRVRVSWNADMFAENLRRTVEALEYDVAEARNASKSGQRRDTRAI